MTERAAAQPLALVRKMLVARLSAVALNRQPELAQRGVYCIKRGDPMATIIIMAHLPAS